MGAEKHILFVSSWWPASNKSNGTFVELHALGLAARRCKCAVLLNSESSFGNYLRTGFKNHQMQDYRRRNELKFIENLVVHLPFMRYSANPLSNRKKSTIRQTLRKIERYIAKEGKPDFIFHHGVFNYTHLSEAISENFGIPVWYMENSPKITAGDIPTANPFVTSADLIDFAKNATRRFAVTKAYVQKMEHVFKLPFELCPNIITDDFFIAPEKRIHPDGYFQFVNVAILDERKNQQLLIRAFAKNFRGHKKYKLVIAGDGGLYNSLRNLSTDLGVQNQVEITGFLNRSELTQLLDQSHCFVLTSKAETFGVVVIEAMARGIPAITSDIDGTRELINERNGLLFEEGNEEKLTSALNQMIDQYPNYNSSIIIQGVKEKYGPDASFKVLFLND